MIEHGATIRMVCQRAAERPWTGNALAASSTQDSPRGTEFLFNTNRLNVATSRARCAAAVVCSPALVGPDCNSVPQMPLANGMCRFGEMAGS